MRRTKKFVMYRRKREGRTNYRKRLKLLVGETPRLVIRKTNKNIILQLVEYSDIGDKVLITVNSSQLKKYGWNHSLGNIPSAYLTGLLMAKRASLKNIPKAIVDIGLQTPSAGSRIYAAVKGAIDAGLNIPCSEDVFPSDARIMGEHIAAYKRSNIVSDFNSVKEKIMKSKL